MVVVVVVRDHPEQTGGTGHTKKSQQCLRKDMLLLSTDLA